MKDTTIITVIIVLKHMLAPTIRINLKLFSEAYCHDVEPSCPFSQRLFRRSHLMIPYDSVPPKARNRGLTLQQE